MIRYSKSAVDGINNTDNSSNIIKTSKVVGVEDIGLSLGKAPKSNLKRGLDLVGGSRVVMTPEKKLSKDMLEILVNSLRERLNVFGLSDVSVRHANDLEGKQYVFVEIADVTKEEVRGLLEQQGKFEAKIANQTVFLGGRKDITYVCRSSSCSGLDPQNGCDKLEEGGYVCSFFFQIALSPEAAQRHAEITDKLDVVKGKDNKMYLSEDLVLYLDDSEITSLRISAGLKGKAQTNVQISGSETGATRQKAAENSLEEMKRLQTIIISGSLPTKLKTVRMDTISPNLGREFTENVITIALIALLSVSVVVYLKYRRFEVVLPMIIALISEVVIILGFAAITGWNLDLAALAGIIIAVGTGVDHLIVITDETYKGAAHYSWKQKIKRAMFIVMGAYFTTLMGMLPLWFAGAGLLRGFAFTTIAGITFGVLLVRPAYASAIEKLFN